MKKPITKRKVSITIENEIYNFLENNFENKSKYVEYLIYKDLKENGLLKKDIIL
jgi:tRNA splicing endonuclease